MPVRTKRGDVKAPTPLQATDSQNSQRGTETSVNVRSLGATCRVNDELHALEQRQIRKLAIYSCDIINAHVLSSGYSHQLIMSTSEHEK